MIEQIKRALATYRVEIFDEIVSTNTYLCQLAKQENIEKMLVVARGQTGGRGRRGRTFHSPKDAGLYMSLLLPLENITESEGLTLRTGVALHRAIIKVFPKIQPSLKWVNDIYVGDKKLAGILVEGVTRPDGVFCAVIGIGMNFLRAAFPVELADRVTSIEHETGESILPLSFVIDLVRELESAWKCPFSDVIETYRTHAYLKGKNLTVLPHQDESYSAKYVDIDERGSLIVEKENGERITLFSGDVSVKPE